MVSRVDTRRVVEKMEVTSTPTCLNFPGGRTLASSRHRPSADVLVSSAADFCHRLDRELRSLGLRRDERQFFVLTLASDPMDVWFGASDLRAGDKDAENSAEAVLRTAVRVETARARKLEEQLEACQVAKAQAEQAAADQEIRARSAEAVQQQLQNRLRRHKMAWEGRAKHAADTVQTMKRMAELDEEANGQQRDELLAELDAARQRVSHAERAVVVCDHNKARMAENFAMMERELRDVRRRAQHDRAQHETTTKRLQAAKEQAESEAEQCRAAAEQAQTELDRTKIRLRQLKDLSNLNRKSGTKMRDDVHTTKLKCLDMESKAAKNQERLKKKEVQLATALRKSANESKARLALQRQIQQLTQQVSTLRSREKSLEDQLAASLAHIEAQDLRLATETRGRLFFRGLLIDCETKLAAVLAAREGAAGQWEAAAGLVEQLLAIASPDQRDSSLQSCLLRMYSFITGSNNAHRKSVVQQGRHLIAPSEAIAVERNIAVERHAFHNCIYENFIDDDKIVKSVIDNIVEAVVTASTSN